jgi:hypothetical protein
MRKWVGTTIVSPSGEGIRDWEDDSVELPEITPAIIATLSGVPENCMPEWGVIITGYLDEHGEPKFETRMVGEQRSTTMIGVLELMKHELVMLSMEAYDYGEEDYDEG